MINISIVDDEKIICELVKKKVQAIIKGKTNIKIDAYENAECFLSVLAERKWCHILLCDIDMPRVDGIELGERVKRMCPELKLVYLTNHSDFAAKSYCVGADQFVLKTDMDNRLPKILRDLLLKVESDMKKYIIVGTSNTYRKIQHANIIFVRKSKGSKYVEVHTLNGVVRERTALNDMEKRLNNPDFIPVERGCLVNVQHIETIDEDKLGLSDGTTISLGRLRAHLVKETIVRYWRGLQ